MVQFKGMVVLLTGGSRGIGPIVSEALAKRGANIALAARSKSGLQDVASRLGELGTKAFVMPIDLSQSSQREKLVADVLKEFGKIDVLINNAGLETEGAYVELSWPSIRETIEVNLIAPMALTRLVLPEMLERKSGHIVCRAYTWESALSRPGRGHLRGMSGRTDHSLPDGGTE